MPADLQYLLFSAWSAVAVPPAPPGLFASSYRYWVTSSLPPGSLRLSALEAPTVHDVPHPVEMSQGDPCAFLECRRLHQPGTPWLHYVPSDMCVLCWERAEKRTTDYVPAEEDE